MSERDPRHAEFWSLVDDYCKEPSPGAWDLIANRLIPGTWRTMWQAWCAVDGGAPLSLPQVAPGVPRLPPAQLWPVYPDAFTLRRALEAAGKGKVPVGLKGLSDLNPAIVPRKRKT